MNSRPMILRFSSGSVTPASAVEELLGGVDDVQLDAGGGDEVALDLLGLALAQQPVVDEHAGELVADGPLHERRGDRGVDAAGQPADGPARRRPARGSRATCSSTMLTHGPGRAAAGDARTGSARAPAGRARCAAPRGGTARRTGRRSVSSNAATGRRRRSRRSPRSPGRRAVHRVAVATSRPAARPGSPASSAPPVGHVERRCAPYSRGAGAGDRRRRAPGAIAWKP